MSKATTLAVIVRSQVGAVVVGGAGDGKGVGDGVGTGVGVGSGVGIGHGPG